MLTRWGYGAPSVWSEMSRLTREMDRLFGAANATRDAGVFPSLNAHDDGENLIVQAEVPGMDPERLEIHATSSALTIQGERKTAQVPEGASFHRRERGYGSFNRTINLPHDIDSSKVRADYKLGILTVTLPKAEEAKPRKIAIRA